MQELVDARRRGRQRGEQLRHSRQQTEIEDRVSVGWLLRHPTDHWLRAAVPTVSDPECRTLIEAHIAKLEPTYQQLCRLDWSGDEAVADVICEMQIASTSPGHWKNPVSAVVTAPVKGETAVGEQIEVSLVEQLNGPFNGTLVSLLPNERWRICARVLEDNTLLPLDGTRRSAVSGR